MNQKIKTYLYQLSAIIVLLSAIAFSFWKFLVCYPLALGAIGLLISSLFHGYTGNSIRIKRLYNMQSVGALAMIGAAILMYFQLQYWVATLLVGAILTLYSSFMISFCKKSILKVQEKAK